MRGIVQHDGQDQGQRPMRCERMLRTGQDGDESPPDEEQQEPDGKDFPSADEAGGDRPLRTCQGVDVPIERIVEEHAPEVEARQGQTQREEDRQRERLIRKRQRRNDVGPDRRKVRDSAETKVNGGFGNRPHRLSHGPRRRGRMRA